MDMPERDWKHLRRLKPAALDRFCDQVLQEVVKIATAAEPSSHQRYLNLYKFIHQRDKVLADGFDDHRRSTAPWKIAAIYRLGLLTDEEFAGFSDETRDHVVRINSPPLP